MMQDQAQQPVTETEIDQILDALVALPVDKVIAVRDYVQFLQSRHGPE
jgi:hypothetical protein